MRPTFKIIAIFVVAGVLLSCSFLAPKPTEKPAKEQQGILIVPESNSSVPDLPIPTEKPIKEWRGIPIMEEAIAGVDDGSSYTYSIKVPMAVVKKYYDTEMDKLGWTSLGPVIQTTSDAEMWVFIKGSGNISISVYPQGNGVLFVMVLKVN